VLGSNRLMKCRIIALRLMVIMIWCFI